MIIDAAFAALGQLFTPPLRSALFKTLGLTILALAALWFGLREVFVWLAWPWIDSYLPQFPDWVGWLGLFAAIAAGIGLALALALLISPVSALIAGLFLDDVAEAIEGSAYPDDPPGRPVPTLPALILSLKFFLVVVAGNIVALLLLLVPGVNLIAFFVINGYLLGREFFEFAAMRHMPEGDAKALRSGNAGTVFLGGLIIAAFLAVPVANLLTPIFGSALMVHLFKRIASRDRARL